MLINPSETEADSYLTLSPVLKLWDAILIWLVAVVIPLDGQVTGFTNILSVKVSYFKLIDVDVPMPTDWLGTTSKLIKSPVVKLWDVDTDTCECILSSVPVTWSKLELKLYSKLLDPTFVSPKNARPVELVVSPTWVTIPI